MIRRCDDGVEIDVVVAPRASRNKIAGLHDGRVKIATTAPPVDGAANQAVTKIIAKALGLARTRVVVARGHTSKRKTLLVQGAELAAVQEALT